MDKKCIVIGVGINIAPARLALINTDVNDGDFIILVGNSVDALNALTEFTRQVYQDLSIEVKPIVLNQGLSLVDAVASLRGLVEANAPCDVVIGIAGDRWIATILNLSLVEFRVLRLICSGYSLAKEIVNGYSSKFNEPISLQAVERVLAKLRGKGLINSKPVSKALMHEATELGRLIACG